MTTALIPEIPAHIDELTALRRHFHENPELSHEEHRTAEHIVKRLTEWGIPHKTGIGGAGVVALIEGAGDGPTVGIRGDIDALPITEERKNDYVSKNPGVMHACGHDAHTAMALIAGKILHERRASLKGNVAVVFQPAEESDPCGADLMIKDGLMDIAKIDAMIGYHVSPFLKTGTIAVKPMYSAANADIFDITVHGKGGHAGYPHLTVDPIVISAQIITALQTIRSRRINPLTPCAVTVGVIEGAKKTNVIPASMRVMGTFRTLQQDVREFVGATIKSIAEGVAQGMGGSADVKINYGCPCVYNHTEYSDMFLELAEEILGAGNAIRLTETMMGADDFAFYCQHVPAVYFRLGTGNVEKDTEYPVHHPMFDLDEDALPIGVGLVVKCVEQMQSRPVPAMEI